MAINLASITSIILSAFDTIKHNICSREMGGNKMTDNAAKNETIQVKQYAIQGENKPPFQAIERFLQALTNNHCIKARAILNSFPELATLRGNFFPLPLLIAASHGNTQLMNELLEKGACPHLASTQPFFMKLPEKSKKYIHMICSFRQGILDKIQGLH